MERKLKQRFNLTKENDSVYTIAEVNANIFNLKFLALLAFFAAGSELLNDLGMFTVDRLIMLPVISIAIVCFLIPFLVFFVHDTLLKKLPSILRSAGFKYIILVSIYIGIMLVSIVLSFHAILLMTIPALMEAQYCHNRKLAIGMFIATVLLVPIAVYGSFFLGLPDRNFIKNMLTDEEALQPENRLAIATSKRMMEIFLHYVFPRVLGIVLINILTISITKRNARMLDRQRELQEVAQREMEQRNVMQGQVIEELAGIIENRDVSTGEHVIRVKQYVRLIAKQLQKKEKYKDILTDKRIEQIQQASPLHDIGKIAVPDSILLKPGRFTPEEFDKMKVHAPKGGKMVESIFAHFEDKEFLQTAYNIAAFHHEKWNGAGYPNGLCGEEIPLEARIMAIADVYDALVSKRVYKDPMAPKKAFAIILEDAGTHFDPYIVSAIADMESEFAAIANEDIAKSREQFDKQ